MAQLSNWKKSGSRRNIVFKDWRNVNWFCVCFCFSYELLDSAVALLWLDRFSFSRLTFYWSILVVFVRVVDERIRPLCVVKLLRKDLQKLHPFQKCNALDFKGQLRRPAAICLLHRRRQKDSDEISRVKSATKRRRRDGRSTTLEQNCI